MRGGYTCVRVGSSCCFILDQLLVEGRAHLIKDTSDEGERGSELFEVLEGGVLRDVPRAQNVLYFPRHQEFLELEGDVYGAMGDMEVTDEEHEHG